MNDEERKNNNAVYIAILTWGFVLSWFLSGCGSADLDIPDMTTVNGRESVSLELESLKTEGVEACRTVAQTAADAEYESCITYLGEEFCEAERNKWVTDRVLQFESEYRMAESILESCKVPEYEVFYKDCLASYYNFMNAISDRCRA